MAKKKPTNLFEFAMDIQTEIIITWRPYSVCEFRCELKDLRVENNFDTTYGAGETILSAMKCLVERIKGHTLIEHNGIQIQRPNFKVPANLEIPKTMRGLEKIQPTLIFLKDKRK